MSDSDFGGTSPMHLDEQQFAAWNDVMARAHNPDDFHKKSTGLVAYVNRRRVAKVLKLLQAEQDHRVLEVGCGAGNILAQVPSKWRTGIDLSEYLLNLARSNCGPDVELLQANCESLPFDDETFDRVYCTEVIEHVQDPGRVLAEIARVLKPTGRAVVSLPNDSSINFAKSVFRRLGLFRLLLGSKNRGSYQPPQENEWHINHLNSTSLRALCQPFLRETRISYIPCRLFPVHYVLALEKAA